MPTASRDVHAPDRELDVLGRLLLALQRGTDLRDVLGSMDFWATGHPGGGYVLEWRAGPYADELRDELVTQLVEGESRLLGSDDFVVRTDIEHRDTQHRLFLLIRGVRIEFRSCDPVVGLNQAREDNWAQFRREFGALYVITRCITPRCRGGGRAVRRRLRRGPAVRCRESPTHCRVLSTGRESFPFTKPLAFST